MKKQIVVTRVFNAPVESVWETWKDPELVKQWWGPARYTCPRAVIDFRVGGVSLVSMKAPGNSEEIYSIWTYTKIVPLQQIEFTQNLADKDGNKVDPVSIGMPPDFPEAIPTVVSFKILGANKTEMVVTEYADMGQMAEFAKLGLEQCMDKLFATVK